MKLSLWLLIITAAASNSLFGQAAEFSFSGGSSRFGGSSDLGSGYSLDNGFSMAGRLTLNSQKFFGHEVGYAYNRTHLKLNGVDAGGMAVHQGFYDFLAYAMPEGSKFRPFATGGAHFSNFVPPGASATQGGGSTKFGVNYGGGVKVRVTSKYTVRADYRQYLTGKPFDQPGASGMLKQSVITVGFALAL